MLLRPVSGSGALAAATELMAQYGPDSYIGRTAAAIVRRRADVRRELRQDVQDFFDAALNVSCQLHGVLRLCRVVFGGNDGFFKVDGDGTRKRRYISGCFVRCLGIR